MIGFFRRFFSSKFGVVFAILFIALIGLAFALADVSAPGGSLGGGTSLAQVDGEDIGEERIQTLLNRALQDARQQQPGIDMNAFIADGALDDALDAEIRNAALRAFASDNGLVVSKRLIDGVIASIPAFQGLTGEFDETSFRQILQQQNLGEEEVRRDLAGPTFLRLILGPVTAAARVSASVARPYAGLLLEERRGLVIAVPSATMPQGNPPTAAELNTFYNENERRYTLPERRKARYAAFSLDQLTVPDPTEAQVRTYYRENSDQYGSGETRTLSQVILPNEAEARAFHDAVRGGSSFAAEADARDFPLSATRVVGTTEAAFGRAADDAIATAAFAADEGDLLEPMRSGLGWHVVQVADINRRNQVSLGSVRAEIVQALREQLRNETLAEFYLEIENALDDGATLEEVADAKGLTLQETPLLAPNGADPSRPDYRPDAGLRPILEAAFTMDEDEDPLVVPIEENRSYALVDVTQIARSAPQPLARIRPVITRDFLADRASRRAQRVAAGIAAKINNGISVGQAISEAAIDLPPPQPAQATRRAISEQGRNVPAPVRLMFRMAENTAKLVRLPQDRGWFVVVLDTIERNTDQITEGIVAATQQQFAQVTATEYAEQFVGAVLAEYEATRDEEAIRAFSNRLTGRAN